jgi:hypothetical protein
MADIINAAVQVKDLQKEHQASIDNLRQQYFKMSEAADKHKFLQDNQYIKYDLLELEELLVKGGYLEPEETKGLLTSSTTMSSTMPPSYCLLSIRRSMRLPLRSSPRWPPQSLTPTI